MTATKNRPKQVSKRPTPRSAKAHRKAVASASANGEGKLKVGGPGKFDVKQKPLIEDADTRVPALDEECQRYLSERDKKRSAKIEMDEALEQIGKLLHEHDLNLYVINGEKFFEEPGSPSIKVVKVKQKG